MKTFILLTFIFFAPFAKAQQLITYENSYKGIQTGKSTLVDAINAIGAYPYSELENSNNMKYFFDTFELTIQNKTGRVNTIIVIDDKYTDPNGVKIGTRKSVVRRIPDAKVASESIVDKRKGIVYWFRNNKVNRIVLTYQMLSY